MKNFITLLAALPLFAVSQISTAAILDFEEVPGGSIEGTFGDMPTYLGFDFSSTLDWLDVGNSYGAISGSFALLNNAGGVGTVIESSTIDFTFDGLWAKHKSTRPGPELLGSMSGYNDDNLVWEVDTSLNLNYQYIGPQAGFIDELRLDFGNFFLVDDLELNAVPVPAAAWLFGSGLIALFGLARRRSQA